PGVLLSSSLMRPTLSCSTLRPLACVPGLIASSSLQASGCAGVRLWTRFRAWLIQAGVYPRSSSSLLVLPRKWLQVHHPLRQFFPASSILSMGPHLSGITLASISAFYPTRRSYSAIAFLSMALIQFHWPGASFLAFVVSSSTWSLNTWTFI